MRAKLRDTIFWVVTLLHSALGTCNRLKTSSSAEKDKKIRGLGYNGSLPGLPHCDDIGHLIIEGHCLRTRHGERNLIDNTEDENLKGARIRIIATPCLNCVKDLVAKEVGEIFFTGSYTNSLGKEYIDSICRDKGVRLEHVEVDWQEALQTILDLLAQPGGILYNSGYRLRVVKEKL